MDFHGFEAAQGQNLSGGTPLSLVMHLSFANQGKGYVGKLDKVSAGAHAAVAGDVGIDAVIEETRQKPYNVRMYSGAGLKECAYAGNHGSPYGCVS